jgi:DNA-binding HxlR family transcriptional regulator
METKCQNSHFTHLNLLHPFFLVESLLELLAKKGTKEILMKLKTEPKHFNQIAIALEHTIARKTLARRMKELNEAGLIERLVVQGRPIGTRYSLSHKGRHILESFLEFENRVKRLDIDRPSEHS